MIHLRVRRFSPTFLLLSLTATGVAAQPSVLQQRLANATALRCAFSVVASGTWTAGVPEAASKPAKLTTTFKNVNVDEGTADAEGTFGGAFIVVRHANDYLHLMQTYSGGPLYTTTVFARESRDGRLIAVHTRHEYTDVAVAGFTSRPETYFGDCAVE